MNRAIAKHLCVGLAGCLSIGANALFAVPAPLPCATNDYAWHFAKGSDSLGWTTMNYRSCAVTNGQLVGVTTCVHGKTSPFLFSPTMELDTSRYGVLRFIATSDLDYPAQGVVLFRRKGEKFNDENRLAFLFKGGGRPCVYSLDLTKHKNWSGTAEQFRFVMCYQDGVKIEIHYIAVLKTPAAHDVLRNGSFEEFALGNSIEAWSVASSGVAASLAGERHTDGRQSLALAGKGACVVHTSAGLNFLNPGDAWVFSMDYLPAGGTGHLKVTWIFSDALEKEIGRQAEVITLKAAQAFQAYSRRLVPDELTESIRVELEACFPEESKVYVDRCALVKEQPKTESPQPAPAERRPGQPPGEEATAPDPVVLKSKAEQAGLPAASIRRVNGQAPALMINGIPREILHDVTGDKLAHLTEANLGPCRDNGIHLYWLPLLSWGGPDVERGNLSFALFDERCRKILEADPEARILLTFIVDSYFNADLKWWNKKYPDELVKDEKGNTRVPFYSAKNLGEAPSWASKVWLEDQKGYVRALIRHVRQSSYAHRILGFMPISGLGAEWQYWGSQASCYFAADYSAPFIEKYQSWLADRYGDVDALNAAYRKGFKTFKEVPLPTPEERKAAYYYSFLDPQANRHLIDFRTFFSWLVSGVILEFARVVKEESEGRSLFGTYYGYSPYLATRDAEVGHFALGRVLRSKDVDFLTVLARYDNRMPGQEGGVLSAEGSFPLHNKLLIAQTDTRTVRSTQQPGCDSIHSSVAVIQREFMNTLAGGMGFEINVFGHGWIEQDKRMMQVLGKCRQLEEDMRKVPRKILDKETSVAVIVDELSTYYTVQGAPQHGIAVNEQTKDLAHAGVGFDPFMIEDLEKIPDYTCYFFLNTFLLTDRQKAFIDKKLKRDNKTLVWLYAPGLIDGQRLSPSHIQEVTGIAMDIQERAVRPEVVITDTDDPVSRHMGKNSRFSYFSSKEIGPLFIPREGRVLGVLQGTDTPALVVKRHADWVSVYSFCPRLPPSLIRGIAQSARVQIMSYENEDSCYISDCLLGVHTASGGERTFYPPKGTKKVRELFRDREYDVRGGSFAVSLQPVSSYLFYMER